jgi:hypothetical protein
MGVRVREYVLDNASGEFPGPLVLFQNDIDRLASFYHISRDVLGH